LTLVEQDESMKTTKSKQPDGCWKVPCEDWSAITQHLPKMLDSDIVSPGPRVSNRLRRNSSPSPVGDNMGVQKNIENEGAQPPQGYLSTLET